MKWKIVINTYLHKIFTKSYGYDLFGNGKETMASLFPIENSMTHIWTAKIPPTKK